MLVAPHDAALPLLHFRLFPGVSAAATGHFGATTVVRARTMFPRLQEILRRPNPALAALYSPEAFDAGSAGAEKLSPSSTPAPNENPDLRDASALKFGVCRYVGRPPRRDAPPLAFSAVSGGYRHFRRSFRCDDGRPGADNVPEAPGNFAPPESGTSGPLLARSV